MTGKKPAELEEMLELPDLFAEVWSWFLRLNNRRQSSGFGYNPLSYSEIAAFFDLLEYSPQQWELEVIEVLDSVAMKHFEKEADKQQKIQEQKSKAKSK